jgi:GWxTD domain-containing protein
LAKFWTDVENGQHEGIDFTRTIFLDRILTANQRYHAMGKEGWLTDRGRVYLLYAEPDEVERFPSSSVNKPYEIWHYNQIESGVIFVFIDRSGLGNYTLVHSTKRGEIQDESWQQYLQ